jgi:CRP-like cAMP-binding protein
MPDKSPLVDTSPLIRVLNELHPLSPEVIAYFKEHVTYSYFPRGRLLLEAGTVCEYIYFIMRGAVRGFITSDKKDITTWITAENEMVTAITSLDLEIPAFESMEAIEDCEMLVLKNTDLKQLYLQYPEFNITGRKLLQQYYRDAESRAYIARIAHADLKYQYFLQRHSQLSNRIPLKYIASYLGITIETLSRVRKRLSTGK